jgi:hypothetical protein
VDELSEGAGPGRGHLHFANPIDVPDSEQEIVT